MCVDNLCVGVSWHNPSALTPGVLSAAALATGVEPGS